MRVVLSPASQRDLSDVVLYIARDNPRRARTYVAEIRRTCLSLGERPERFPAAQEPGPTIRLTHHGSCLIFYSIDASVFR